MVYNLQNTVKNVSGITLHTLTNNITWPNEITQITSSSNLNLPNGGLLIAGGFLVPPKTVGAIHVVTTDPSTGILTNSYKVSTDNGNAILGGYFYHRAFLKDINGDGKTDILSARAIKPLFGSSNGQLVWFEQPSNPPNNNPFDSSVLPWTEHILTNGSWSPDVLYTVTNLRNDNDEEIFYTSFFTGGGLGMLLCPDCGNKGSSSNPNTWSNTSNIIETVLDASIGPAFDVQVIDLNNDGRMDLLVTNHVDNATDGGTPASGVFAYEAPSPGIPLTNVSAWTKHTLASGFVVREFGPNQAAPGAFQAFYPCTSVQNQKPYALIGGDGDQRAYMLIPNSQNTDDWTYTLQEFHDCQGTVGQSTVFDSNNDGCMEVFVPCYDSGVVHVWEYSTV